MNNGETVKKITLKCAVFVACFIVFFTAMIFFKLVCMAGVTDFFSRERITVLKNRPTSFTRDVIVDLTFIKFVGGIQILTKNILQGIIKKRPDWRLIFLVSECTNKSFLNFASSSENVKTIFVHPKKGFFILDLVFRWLNFVTLGFMESKLQQLIFFDALFADNSCDLIWDPAAGQNTAAFVTPMVCTVHDLAYKDIGALYPPFGVKLAHINMSASVKYAEKIITVSDFTKRRLREEFRLPESKIEKIYIKVANRLKRDASAEEAKNVLEKYGLKDKEYLIYTSCAWPQKNYSRLMKAFSDFIRDPANKKAKNIKLLITGNGTKKIAAAGAEKSHLGDRIIGLDFVPEKDLNILMSHALAFIHPSVYEGFGIPVIEAMIAGVPVASSTAGSLPEIAGDAALYFDPYSVEEIKKAVEKIVFDGNLRKSLIKLGYRRAEIFTDNDAMIDDYIRVFEEAMNNGRKNKNRLRKSN
ncbi:MAG: glycosyltransferase family 4 protein [Holosporaceae bacterium]|jgi:glycosyltransferase involved in cell wall biosynthesis|nr:glycosyltransferase family 4 protein [Holosporaceae bacterium]